MTYRRAFEDFERRYLLTILRECRFHQGRAAQMAGVHRNTITRMVMKYHVDTPRTRYRTPVESRPAMLNRLAQDRTRLIAELECEREGLRKTKDRMNQLASLTTVVRTDEVA